LEGSAKAYGGESISARQPVIRRIEELRGKKENALGKRTPIRWRKSIRRTKFFES